MRTRRRRVLRIAIALALIVSAAGLAGAQRGGGRRSWAAQWEHVPYNGKLTFTRLRYNGGWGRGSNAWNHDYPQADQNLPLILDAVTLIQPNTHGTNILDLEDPEIFVNPVLYMWEPGGWQITEEGARNLRDYMLKGGFVVFDDFEAGQWYNFEAQFRRALPEAQFIELDRSHPLFHSFFEMDELNLPHPFVRVLPAFYGVFEDNDPTRRMMAFVCYNSDVAEYWEYSGTGYFPVDTTNDAYKLGVNFMVYALTH
jgi:hypothetical protein